MYKDTYKKLFAFIPIPPVKLEATFEKSNIPRVKKYPLRITPYTKIPRSSDVSNPFFLNTNNVLKFLKSSLFLKKNNKGSTRKNTILIGILKK